MSNNYNTDSTIIANATGIGGAISIIRISGDDAFGLLEQIFIAPSWKKNESHKLIFGRIIGKDGSTIDECLVARFKGPNSFTGEDSVEINCHASPYITQIINQRLIELGGRLAGPGEFTMRAYLNRKMDLTQAEGVADLIKADSEGSHRLALLQMKGEFSNALQTLREKLIKLASLLELELDFGEEDVEFADRVELKASMNKIKAELETLLESFKLGNAIKEGFSVAIIGSPNVGKSTLLNKLLNDDKAIVTDIPGTTRDVIEDTVVWGGYKIRFADTAGIRDTIDIVEKMGIERSVQAIKRADVLLLLSEVGTKIDIELESLVLSNLPSKSLILKVRTKDDHAIFESNSEEISISAKNDLGLELLKENILQYIHNLQKDNHTLLTNLRHYQEIQMAKNALEKGIEVFESGLSGDFIAMEIRYALQHIGNLTGTIHSDDLLDVIFRDFCIGK